MGTLKTKARILISTILGKYFQSIPIPTTPIISFDVFDTLIVRSTLAVPSDLFDNLSPNPTFKDRRIEAEKRARAESGKEDITLEEIYEKLYSNPRERQEAMEREINAELKACKANPDALAFFNRCKEVGKRIIIISDMYLNSHTIQTILTNCGYDLTTVPIYVSSEYSLTKRTGNLFKKVLEIERVRANEVLHLGDNPRSDYLRPKLIGMKAVVVETPHVDR